MSEVRITVNEKAMAALRTSSGVVAEITRIAEEWLNEANATLDEGFGYQMAVHRNTSRRGPYTVARVYTYTAHAINSNAKHQTLARIVGR